MNKLRFLLCTLLVATIIFSCSKDESIIYDQTIEQTVRNQHNNSNTAESESSIFNLDDSGRPCTGVDLTQLSEDDHFINDPLIISEIETAVSVKGVNYSIDLLSNEIGNPIYTRIISTQTEGQTETIYWIPFEKPSQSLISAVLPVIVRNNTFTVGKVIPRMKIVQLATEDITNEIITEARIFNTLDIRIFNLYSLLMHEIAMMEYEDKESQTRECGWLTVSWTTVVSTGGNVNVDEICPNPSKQIKYKPPGTEITHHSVSVFWCDSWGEAPTDASDWSNPPNIIGGSGTYNPDGFISELEFEYAEEKHNFLKQHSPFYSFLDEQFKECENGEFGAEIGPNMIADILALLDSDLNGQSVDYIKEELEGVYNPEALFGYLQNAVEKLAELGVELSFTQTIIAVNSIAMEYSQLYESLCEVSNEDREILLDDFDNVTLINSTENQQTAYINFMKNFPNLVTDPADKLKLLSNPDFTIQLLSFLDTNSNNPNYQYGQLANEIAPLCLSYQGTLSTLQLFSNAKNLHNLIIETPCVKPDDLTFLLSSPKSVNWATIFMNGDCNDETKIKYTLSVFDLLESDSEFVPDRFTDLYNLVEANINILTECDESPTNLDDWSALASFVPPQNLLDKLEELGEGWRLQGFLEPTTAPNLNLDYFSITISELPLNPETGINFSSEEFFSYFRKNINDFVNKDASEFNPTEEQIWLSDNPIGAVLSIDIEGPDNGSVICSQYEECCWIFSTVKAPFMPGYDGFHPVSGNRQFGYSINYNGSMELYTRGVDRYFYPSDSSPYISTGEAFGQLFGYILEKVAFAGADGLWISMQDGLKSFVGANGGSATINTPEIRRPNKSKLLELLKQDYPINSIPCED